MRLRVPAHEQDAVCPDTPVSVADPANPGRRNARAALRAAAAVDHQIVVSETMGFVEPGPRRRQDDRRPAPQALGARLVRNGGECDRK